MAYREMMFFVVITTVDTLQEFALYIGKEIRSKYQDTYTSPAARATASVSIRLSFAMLRGSMKHNMSLKIKRT